MQVVFELLDTEQRRCFMQLVALAMQQAGLLSSREERSLVAGLIEQLELAGLPNARHKATILVQMGAQEHLVTFMPLLQHPQIPFILGVAHSLAMLGGNARNINDAVTRVANLASALKSYSHPGARQEMVEADIQDELENVLTLYQGQIKSDTELVCHFTRVAPLLCFPEQLNQIWVNLIHNALQAMQERGTLTVSLERIGDDAVIAISDTGCGIPPENRERIFAPFFTTKAVGVGTGLGLDIVRKIVEIHHGRIELESEVGRGSTFRVYLPYGTLSAAPD
jgi:signal transduction histidine kinase